MRKMLLVCSMAFLAAAVSGCSHKLEIPGDPKTIVLENIKAMENKDLERVMATTDEESGSYEQTKTLTQKIFDTYDLKYELDSVTVIGQTDAEAKVECIQTTSKLKGPAFRDNRIDIVHRLRNTNGIWRIYSSQIKRIDYLN